MWSPVTVDNSNSVKQFSGLRNGEGRGVEAGAKEGRCAEGDRKRSGLVAAPRCGV